MADAGLAHFDTGDRTAMNMLAGQGAVFSADWKQLDFQGLLTAV
jgi:hypothetical protein